MDVRFLDEESLRRYPAPEELKHMGLTKKEFDIIDSGMKDAKARKLYPRIKEPDLWKDEDYNEF